MSGLSLADARARADKLLEQVGLAGRADRPVRRFSKGMVQRLALAQSLIGDPEVVILDEPMSGLDPIGRKDVRDVILKLRAEGRTVLFSTHILSDVEALCDRVGMVIEGKLTDCGSLRDLVAPGARAFELVIDGLPQELPAAIAELSRASGGQSLRNNRSWVFTLTEEAQAQALLRAALAQDGKLVSFTPHRHTLEDLFVSRARASAVSLVIERLAALAPRLWLAYAFTVGAVVGSFLNVVIARVPRGESIVHPRSAARAACSRSPGSTTCPSSPGSSCAPAAVAARSRSASAIRSSRP